MSTGEGDSKKTPGGRTVLKCGHTREVAVHQCGVSGASTVAGPERPHTRAPPQALARSPAQAMVSRIFVLALR